MTCANEAAALACGSNSQKTEEMGHWSSRASALSISGNGRGGTLSCSTSSVLQISTPSV